MIHGGADTGWTFYTPYSTHDARPTVVPMLLGVVHHRLLVDPHRPQLHRHRPHDARARASPGCKLPLFVWTIYATSDHPGAGDAGARHACCCSSPSSTRSASASSTRRAAATRCSSSTCSGSTRTRPSTSWCCRRWGSCQRGRSRVRAQEHLRLQGDRVLVASASRSSASSPGATTCSCPASRRSTPASSASLSMLVGVFTAIKVFNWVGTLYKGAIQLHDAVRLLLRLHLPRSCSAA